MINLPFEEIITRIKAQSSISEDDLRARIKQKMDQLSGLISKEGAAYIIANELGIKLIQTQGTLKIKDIFSGMRNVETLGKVTRKFPVNSFEKNGNPGKVGSFIIADESGTMRITAWNDMVSILDEFKEGDIIKLTGAYVRENNGQRELHLGSTSKIIVNPAGVMIDVVVSTPAQMTRKKISELSENDFTEILGTIVQVFDPRFYPVCPQCQKKVSQNTEGFKCAEHGVVTPTYGYVLNVFIDDGSDSIRAVFFRNTVLDLTNKDDALLQECRNAPEKFEQVKNQLLGETIKISGRVSKNQMFDRLEIMANRVQQVDPATEIRNHAMPTIDDI